MKQQGRKQEQDKQQPSQEQKYGETTTTNKATLQTKHVEEQEQKQRG